MTTRIYVGHLPYSANDQDLFALFRSYGIVTEASVSVDRATGQSRGFGYVEMPDELAARVAIARLNGYRLDQQAIQVAVAKLRAGEIGPVLRVVRAVGSSTQPGTSPSARRAHDTPEASKMRCARIG